MGKSTTTRSISAKAACVFASILLACSLAFAGAVCAPAATAYAAAAAETPLTVQASTSQTALTTQAAKNGLISGHIYIITSALGPKWTLDIAGASTKNGANAQIWTANRSLAQQWKYTVNSKGQATLTCLASGKVLEVKGGKKASGTNVRQNASKGKKYQKWKISLNSNGTYRIASALSSKRVLDVSGAQKANGANVQIWARNNTLAQQWVFFDVTAMYADLDAQAAASAKDLAGKVYFITSGLKQSMALDVKGASKKNGANVQLYRSNGTSAQKWTLAFDDAGYATIKNGSGKMLAVKGASTAVGANVVQRTEDGSRAQKWIVSKNADGTYAIRSALWADLSLGVSTSNVTNGTNVKIRKSSTAKGQKWSFATEVAPTAGLSASVIESLEGIDMTGVTAVGIDVSQWQGPIDWNKVAASGIDFAIIRCGYGDDWTVQDDTYFFQNVQGAKAAGLDLGVYLYSYAIRTKGSSSATSEAEHTLRLLKAAGLSPSDLKYGVSYDVEDPSQESKALVSICKTYCTIIQAAGYRAGIYSYLYWWNSKLASSELDKWDRFVAQWGVESCWYEGDYALWQFTSDGSVPGIEGRVDMDLAY